MEQQNKFVHGNHTHNHYYQDRFPLESRTERKTLVFTPSEIAEFEELAKQRGFSETSKFIRHLANIGRKFEKYLNVTMGDILD